MVPARRNRNMILAIIQARIGGTRLPGKVMEPLAGIPMIDHIVERVRAAELVHRVVVAIPDTPENEALGEYVKAFGVDVHRGSEDDVLSRFYWASQICNPDIIVRITADDPFKDRQRFNPAPRRFR